ncbi:hypothetical protein [Sutterella sp.]|uniref:hypothetical protein n=1 Tax=Sutterella sp. TaxID=1981025 RepID=UPI0026DF4F14|nr:hypothetical protein [Sutterella sp.]MDO5531600.1 hypothetical protein [Sutterella sp.]
MTQEVITRSAANAPALHSPRTLREFLAIIGERSGIDAAVRASFGTDADKFIDFSRSLIVSSGHSLFITPAWSTQHQPGDYAEMLRRITSDPEARTAFFKARRSAVGADTGRTYAFVIENVGCDEEGEPKAGIHMTLVGGPSLQPYALIDMPEGSVDDAFDGLEGLADPSTQLVCVTDPNEWAETAENVATSERPIVCCLGGPCPESLRDHLDAAGAAVCMGEEQPADEGGSPLKAVTVPGVPGMTALSTDSVMTTFVFNPPAMKTEATRLEHRALDIKSKLGARQAVHSSEDHEIIREAFVREPAGTCKGRRRGAAVKWRIDRTKLESLARRNTSVVWISNCEIDPDQVSRIFDKHPEESDFFLPDAEHYDENELAGFLVGFNDPEMRPGRLFLQFVAYCLCSWYAAIVSEMTKRQTLPEDPCRDLVQTLLAVTLDNDGDPGRSLIFSRLGLRAMDGGTGRAAGVNFPPEFTDEVFAEMEDRFFKLFDEVSAHRAA